MSDLSSLSSLSSLSASDADEEPKRIRTIRERNNPFQMYDEHDFKIRFRFSKDTVMAILHLFEDAIQPLTNRNKAISSLTQLLITLRFYATGAFQQMIGDSVNIHKSTVSRIVQRVTHSIARKKNYYIRMPSMQELPRVKEDFFIVSNFPGVVGAIDCTHVRIQSPGGADAELFRNRKGYFSINVQMVCDAKLRIRHVIARWPGSVHDSTIFNDCPLGVEFERGSYGNGYMLGDSAYPCKPYLLTPFGAPSTASEEAYNRAHISTRNPIERCFGVLKRRFPCLHSGMRIKMDTCLASIVACAVLHNIALSEHDEVPDDEDLELLAADDNVLVNPVVEDIQQAGRNVNTAVRRSLVATVFTR